MQYQQLCEVYENLEQNPSRLKKTAILADFLVKLKNSNLPETIYLLQGKVFPDYSEKEFGISEKLCIKALSKASGISNKEIVLKWKKLGDLGKVAEEIMTNKKQGTLFSHELTVKKVLDNLQRLPGLEGKGAVDKKMSIISELLTSTKSKQAKYIIRTLIGDLRIGVAAGTLRDSVVHACFSKKDLEDSEKKKEITGAVQDAYDKATDWKIVFEKACKGIKSLQTIILTPGHPVKVMLALKAESIEDGFKRCGKPAAIEYKYDGFRMLINKDEKGEIKIFTRRLDEVTNQFPDVVKYVKEHVKAKSFMLDSEAIGF
ncbi:MAG: DNA ligase, partial [archaeon]